jgi:thiol-disulfide isomerase/thioredoxin
MNLIDVLKKYFAPYYGPVLALTILIIFIIAAYYAYQQYVSKINRFNDVANENHRKKEADVMFFHADWCPHCKKAEPEWTTFCSQNDGKEINGYIVHCVDVNCTKETNEVTNTINQYGISSYPTVKLVKDNETIEFDSKITSSSLDAFVTTVLN